MALIEWNHEFSVGVPSLDLQHQQMFGMINQQYKAMRAGNVGEVVPAILQNLEAYCREHFAYEESLMLKAKYPDLLLHKAEHIHLTEKALVLAREFDERKIVRSLSLLTFLKEWTQRHILFSDKQYCGYLQSAGIDQSEEEPYHESQPELISRALSPALASLMGRSTVIRRR